MFWQGYWGRRVLHQWAGTLAHTRRTSCYIVQRRKQKIERTCCKLRLTHARGARPAQQKNPLHDVEALRGAFKIMKRTDASLAAEARGCDLQPHASRIAPRNLRNRDPKTQKAASERNKNIVEIGSFTLEKNRRRNNCKSAIYMYIARFFTQRELHAECTLQEVELRVPRGKY
jgi:hypothetical protein